jgi:predicted nucleotidyltransferase
MIPAFDDYGCLPEGIYDCTMVEAAQRFGVFQTSDRRPQLWDKFIEFMREAKSCGLIDAVLLNGSFVTGENEPNDIDLVVVVSSDHDFSAEFQPGEYNVLSKRQVHRRFGFDLLVARSESEEYRRYLEFFQQVRLEPGRKKGIVRIWLR